jgi:hypothetical protein
MLRRLWPFVILILMPRIFNADMGFALCFVVAVSMRGAETSHLDEGRTDNSPA